MVNLKDIKMTLAMGIIGREALEGTVAESESFLAVARKLRNGAITSKILDQKNIGPPLGGSFFAAGR